MQTTTVHIRETYNTVSDFLGLNPVDYSIQNVATIAQLKKLWKLDMQAYEGCTIPFSVFKQWWSRYPFGSIVYLETQREEAEILASIGLYPIEAGMAEHFMQGDIPEATLVPVNLRDCQRKPQHFWYASGILLNDTLLRADPQRMLRDHPIRPLLKTGLQLCLSSGHVAFPATLFALGLTTEGINMLTRFGFVESRSAALMPDGCALYKVELASKEQVLEILKGRSLHDSSRV